ncbi:hypothetical protein AB0M22_09395 [Nocardia sp. NPDC051756]|uniref:hypothetical protein n=1 Tax=Nocardia sp. NPDC051756 TaxID=3154751 RepID=UPI003447235C
MSHDIADDFAEFFAESAAAADASLTADIHAQIEASSLGTPQARALRESVPVEVGAEIVRRANAQRERDQLVDLLYTNPWRSWPRTAHNEHIYHGSCALCLLDLKAIADLILANGWRRNTPETPSSQVDRTDPCGEVTSPGPLRAGDARGPGGAPNVP